MGHAEDRRDFPPTPRKNSTEPDDLFGPVPAADVDRSADLNLLRFPEWPKAEPTPDFDFGDWFPESDESRETRVLAQPRIVHVPPNPRSTLTQWRRHRRKVVVGLGGLAVIGVLAVARDSIPPLFGSDIASASVSPVGPSLDTPGLIATPEATPAPLTPPVPGEIPVPQVVGPRATYSVALASYRGRSLAVAHRDALAAAAPEHLFVLAPLMVNGQLFHRVLGGLAEDSTGIGTVAQEISAATGKPASPWIVRDARLAFTIDEIGDKSAAERRVADLRELGIPADVLSVIYSDESTAHRVLAGACATASEAEHLGKILLDHQLGSARLEPRVGLFDH